MTTVLERLTEGRERIAHGYSKGDYEKVVCGRQCFCSLGAVGLHYDGSGVAEQCAVALYNALPDEWRVMWGPRTLENFEKRVRVVRFNDHQETKKADVLALFDRAIASVS